MNPKHFAGLDGLRFVSITFVVLHHLFTFKANFGFHKFDYPVLGLIGYYGIHFFFMGSGFLITYLLLHEFKAYGRISLRHFFLRRIMRIWPAYYLLIILFLLVLHLSFFRMPETTDAYLSGNYILSNRLFLLFLPHVQPFVGSTAPYIHHTYTIGIEEQFYIVWGLLFFFLRKHIYWIFWVILLSMPLLNFLHELGYEYVQQSPSPSLFIRYFNSAATFLNYSRLSTFAVGALFGYAYFHQKGWIQLFKKKPVQVGLYAVVLLSVFFNLRLPYLGDEYIAVLMACLMLSATFRESSIINYSAGWLSYLGRISYGIYLFHIFAIVLACKIVQLFARDETNFFVVVMLCILTMAISIFFGWLSYHYFEVFFLKLKRKFRRVQTAHE